MSRLLVLVLVILCSPLCRASTADQDAFVNIYDNILQKNAVAAVESCLQMQKALPQKDAPSRQAAFEQLAQAWAKVQASYILGGYDMDAMDYPLMVDYYHAGKEDVHESLLRIAAADTPVATALYKNSYKNMGTLDDVLFSGDWSKRREEMATLITDRICKNLTRIQDGYRNNRDEFLADQQKALSLLINAQIDSIYKTRDWRIAQVGGLTKHNLGQPMPQNQQYPWSKASWSVIGAILSTHEQLLGEEQQPNLATIAHQKHADAGLQTVQDALQRTLDAYRATPPNHNFNTQDMIPMFQGLLDIQKAFYRHLVSSIGVTANIIDADGD